MPCPVSVTVVVRGRYRGIYRKNGKKLDAQFVQVFKLRNGIIISYQEYTDSYQYAEVMGEISGRKAA
ncbi:MAG: hypothetical protein BWY76_00603 [bacterium ADurb.Bin429]|nr:MAG: hypothetical protein BWY76_00603 [bacterium ADurb.Bin429]